MQVLTDKPLGWHPSGLSWADADRLGPAGVAVVICEQALVLDGLALELAK